MKFYLEFCPYLGESGGLSSKFCPLEIAEELLQ